MPRTGRKRTTGNSSKPKIYKRVAVSYRFKLRVLRFFDCHIMEETIGRFYPGLVRAHVRSKKRLCYSWKANRVLIEAKCAAGMGSHHHRRARGMGATIPGVAEEQLVRWVNDLRADGVPVTGLMLKLQARDLYAATGLPRGAFTASWSWRKHFLRRQKLAIHRSTREGKTTPEDALEKLEDFSGQVQAKMAELKITKVYNADQTGVNYEYVPTATINTRGAKTVWVKLAGKSKERVNAMPLGDSDGNKADPFLIFKTRPSKIARDNTVLRHVFGRQLWNELEEKQVDVQIYGNGAGWWNSELSIEFLCYHFAHRENMHEPVLLLWDDVSGHWRYDVLVCARLLNVELMKALQVTPQIRSSNRASPFKMTPPPRPDVIMWIMKAWQSLSTSTIVGGFKKARLLQMPPPDRVEERILEPNWGDLIRILQQQRVPLQSIDPLEDIAEREEEDEDVATEWQF